MDFSCPHCNYSMEKKKHRLVPAQGERKLLPLRMALHCPHCDQQIKINVHPFEKNIRALDLILLIFLIFLSYLFDNKMFFYMGIAISGLAEIGLWYYSKIKLNNWKYYLSSSSK
jgi:hypothetical protein